IAATEHNLKLGPLVFGVGHHAHARESYASRCPSARRPILTQQALPPVIQHPRRNALLLSEGAGLHSTVPPSSGQVQHLVSSVIWCRHVDLLRHKDQGNGRLSKDGVHRTVTSRVHSLRANSEPLSEHERERLLALGADLRALWDHPAAPVELKKRILRTVIEEIVVKRSDEPPRHILHVQWKGGVHTELLVACNGTGQH